MPADKNLLQAIHDWLDTMPTESEQRRKDAQRFLCDETDTDAAATLTWQKTFPTQDGYYWFWDGKNRKATKLGSLHSHKLSWL